MSLSDQGLRQCRNCSQTVDAEVYPCPVCRHNDTDALAKSTVDALALSPRAQPKKVASNEHDNGAEPEANYVAARQALKPVTLPSAAAGPVVPPISIPSADSGSKRAAKSKKQKKEERASNALSLSPRKLDRPKVEGPFNTEVVAAATPAASTSSRKAALPASGAVTSTTAIPEGAGSPRVRKSSPPKGEDAGDVCEEVAEAPRASSPRGGNFGATLKRLLSKPAIQARSDKDSTVDAAKTSIPADAKAASNKKDRDEAPVAAPAASVVVAAAAAAPAEADNEFPSETPSASVPSAGRKSTGIKSLFTLRKAPAEVSGPLERDSEQARLVQEAIKARGTLVRDEEQARIVAAALKAKEEREASAATAATPPDGPTSSRPAVPPKPTLTQKLKTPRKQQQQQPTAGAATIRNKWAAIRAKWSTTQPHSTQRQQQQQQDDAEPEVRVSQAAILLEPQEAFVFCIECGKKCSVLHNNCGVCGTKLVKPATVASSESDGHGAAAIQVPAPAALRRVGTSGQQGKPARPSVMLQLEEAMREVEAGDDVEFMSPTPHDSSEEAGAVQNRRETVMLDLKPPSTMSLRSPETSVAVVRDHPPPSRATVVLDMKPASTMSLQSSEPAAAAPVVRHHPPPSRATVVLQMPPASTMSLASPPKAGSPRRESVVLQLQPASTLTISKREQRHRFQVEMDRRQSRAPAALSTGLESPRAVVPVDQPAPVALEPRETVFTGTGLQPGPQGGRVEFDVELHDNHGALWSGADADVQVEIRAPSGAQLTGRVRSVGGPKYCVTYTRALAGIYTVIVRVDGISAHAPFRVDVFAVVDAQRCVAHGPALEDGLQHVKPVSAILELRDVAGERVPHNNGSHRVTCDATLAGGVAVPATVSDHGDGTFGLALTRAKAGSYTVRLYVDGAPIADSPFRFQVESKCDVSLTRVASLESRCSQSAEPVVFTVTSFDAAHEHVAIEPRVVCMLGDVPVPVTVAAPRGGVYTCSFARLAAGLYSVCIVVDSTPVPGSPFSVNVEPAVDASRTMVKLADDDACTQGTRGLAEIALFDLSGALVCGLSTADAQLDVQVEAPNGSVESAFVRATSAGFRARFDRPVAGVYRLLLRVGSTQLAPVRFVVAPVVDLASVKVAGAALSNGRQSLHEERFEVSACDVSGQPLRFGGDLSAARLVPVQITGPSGKVVAARDCGDGSLGFVRSVCGSYAYQIGSVTGEFYIEQHIDAARTTVVGPGIESGAQSNLPVNLLFQARDVLGDLMRIGWPAADIVVSVTGPETLTCRATDNGDGTFSASYMRTQAGDYTLTVTHDGHELHGSPYRINVSAEADVENVTCTGAVLESGTSMQGDVPSFTIQCVDLAGKPLSGQSFDVAVNGASVGPVTDAGDGTYKCAFETAQHGPIIVLSVQSRGRHVAASPYRIAVAQKLDVSRTVVSGLLDGLKQTLAEQRFTVELFDIHGDRMTRSRNFVAATLDGQDLMVSDNSNGTYTAVYSRSRAGRYRAKVSVNGDHVLAVAFNVAQCVQADATVLMDLPDTCRQGDELRFKALTFDVSGAKMEEGGLPLVVQVRTPRDLIANCARDAHDGSYSCTLLPAQAGVYSVAVVLDGKELVARELVVAQVASAKHSSLLLLLAECSQSRNALDVLQITACDASGEPWEGSAAEFGLNVETGGAEYSVRAASRGIFVVSLVPFVHAGSVELGIMCGDAELPSSPAVLRVAQTLAVSDISLEGGALVDGNQAHDPVSVLALVPDMLSQPYLPQCELQLLVDGPSGPLKTVVEPGEDGSYLLSYQRLEAGVYRYTVLCNGQPIQQGSLTARQVVDPVQCLVAGEGLDNGIFARREAQFVVELRDLTGLALSDDTAPAQLHAVTVQILGGKSGTIMASVMGLQGVGTYACTYEPDTHGQIEVGVLYGSHHLAQSPYTVEVAKPPTAGSQWQQKFNVESEERKKQREQERLAEIEHAKKNFLEHAKQSQIAAKQKEEATLAERRRQAEIAEHAERMRSAEGDAVRAQVLQKLQAQAVEREFEPVLQDEADASKTGKKWAARQQQEVEERNRQRAAEREAEIAAAKLNYADQAAHAVALAKTNEQREFEMKERERIIEETQAAVSRQMGHAPKTEIVARPVERIERTPVSADAGLVPDTGGVVLHYAELKGRKALFLHSSDVDASRLESYLSDAEFETVFKMSKAEFYAMPQWKRAKVLKVVDLF